MEVEILRNRAVLKSWVMKRIALTPLEAEEEETASFWFHEMSVAERSTLITDLARVGIAGVDLRAIAAGPLGDFVRRFPELLKAKEVIVEPIEPSEPIDEVRELVAAVVGSREDDSESVELTWSDGWQIAESRLGETQWHNN
jgi:hypothetical protein